MSSARYDQSEYIWFLQLKNQGLKRRLESFESGSAYVNLKKQYETKLRGVESELKKSKQETAAARAQIVNNRNKWIEVLEDMEKEHAKALAKKDRKIAELEKRILESERQRDEALDKKRDILKEYYKQGEELEKQRGLVQKLTAQVNKDFENSSVPSSQQGAGRKKVHNSRTKSERKRGGQPGHKGHRIKQREATNTTHLPDPEKYVNDPDYYATDEVIRRQKIILTVSATVQEYTATVFRNRKTGSRVHAAFPEGFETDISYDSSVKGLVFVLANKGNMSAGKIRSVLKEITDGAIDISEATINGLCKEFSEKSEPERQEIIRTLMTSPVMNVDFTNANLDGDAKQVLILAAADNAATLFVARDNKGHKGVKDTPLENYVGISVHDHDTTFYSYGLGHQECMQHNIRYLIGSMENEPGRKWNTSMLALIREMIHYMNDLEEDREPDPKIIGEFEERYDQILDLAEKEYEYEPASDYYREGYNLFRRLRKYRESELLFLHDKRVPSNNSRAEREARVFKRKQKSMIVMRGDDNYRCLCDSLSVIQTFNHQDDSNFYNKTCEIFSRPKKRKPRYIPSSNKKAEATT